MAVLNIHPQSQTRMELFGKALGHHGPIRAISTGGRHHPTCPKDLATKCGIGVDTMQQTLEATTQHGVQTNRSLPVSTLLVMCHAWNTHGTATRAILAVTRLHYMWNYLTHTKSCLTDKHA